MLYCNGKSVEVEKILLLWISTQRDGLFSGYCFTKRWISLFLLEYFLSLSLFLRFCCSVCTLVGLLFMLDVFGSK